MKSRLVYLTGMIVIFTISCSKIQEKTAKEILEVPKLRSEIFQEILNNEKYLAEFGVQMATVESKKMSAALNGPLVKSAWESDIMDSLLNNDMKMMEGMINKVVGRMEKDTGTCSMMCGKVMQNKHLKSYVMLHACGSDKKKK